MITEINIKNNSPLFYLSDKIFICAAVLLSFLPFPHAMIMD